MKILPKWYTFQVETGPFFNYYIQTMQQWIEKLDNILSASNRPLLNNAGTISHKQAIEKATQEFEEYRRKEMLQYESDFDRAIKELKSQTDDDSNNTPD